MLFSSNVFIFVFFPLCFLFYYAGKNRSYRNIILLLFSLVFYAWGEPVYVLLMLFSIVFNYGVARGIAAAEAHPSVRKGLLILNDAGNLLMLGYFKYTDFLLDSVNHLLHTALPMRNIALPIGISFFTFQAMSYVIDVYRKDGKAQKNILNVALYISLFPQLIAGPIVRYQTIEHQIMERQESRDDIADGGCRFLIGLGKKVLLSNTVALVADGAFGATTDISVAMGWLGIFAYTLQIYFDFSGYSDMAIGLGRMFGFRFLENFDHPYIANSVTDFWRRWHISLSTWFRDYVYIPLGGNRKGKARQMWNLAVVWVLTGFWHGANWTFVVWGVYYLFLLIIEKNTFGKWMERRKILGHIYALLCVMVGWVIFRADALDAAFVYLRTIFGLNGAPLFGNDALRVLTRYHWYLLIGIFACLPLAGQWVRRLEQYAQKKTWTHWMFTFGKIAYLALIFFLCVTALLSDAYNPFIYFNF